MFQRTLCNLRMRISTHDNMLNVSRRGRVRQRRTMTSSLRNSRLYAERERQRDLVLMSPNKCQLMDNGLGLDFEKTLSRCSFIWSGGDQSKFQPVALISVKLTFFLCSSSSSVMTVDGLANIFRFVKFVFITHATSPANKEELNHHFFLLLLSPSVAAT